MPSSPRATLLGYAALFIGIGLLPLLGAYPVFVMKVLCYALFACAFNLLVGFTGLLSFGHAAFLGVGAYTAGILIAQHGLAWYVAVPAAVLMASLVALLMGLLAIRTRGIYFAMVTLALSQCVYFLVYQMPASGGENGLTGVNVDEISVLGLKLDLLAPLQKYYFVLGFVAIGVTRVHGHGRLVEPPSRATAWR